MCISHQAHTALRHQLHCLGFPSPHGGLEHFHRHHAHDSLCPLTLVGVVERISHPGPLCPLHERYRYVAVPSPLSLPVLRSQHAVISPQPQEVREPEIAVFLSYLQCYGEHARVYERWPRHGQLHVCREQHARLCRPSFLVVRLQVVIYLPRRCVRVSAGCLYASQQLFKAHWCFHRIASFVRRVGMDTTLSSAVRCVSQTETSR